MLCAYDLKSVLADHLIENSVANSILATEVPFCYGFRRADMLLLEQGKIHAFEIKSDLDSLEKLEQQIEDYKNTFPYSSIVVTQKHLSKARQKIPASVGIITISSCGTIRTVRKARENRRLSKNNLIYLLERNILSALLKETGFFPKERAVEVNKLREIGEERLTIQQLANAAYNALFCRYQKSYELFRYDRGVKTTHDDIYYLSGAK